MRISTDQGKNFVFQNLLNSFTVNRLKHHLRISQFLYQKASSTTFFLCWPFHRFLTNNFETFLLYPLSTLPLVLPTNINVIFLLVFLLPCILSFFHKTYQLPWFFLFFSFCFFLPFSAMGIRFQCTVLLFDQTLLKSLSLLNLQCKFYNDVEASLYRWSSALYRALTSNPPKIANLILNISIFGQPFYF